MSENNKEQLKKKNRRRLILGRVMIHIVVPVVLGLAVGAAALFVYYKKEVEKVKSTVYKEVTIEYAHQVKLEDFFDEVPSNANFITNVSMIDTGNIASYDISIKVKGQVCHSTLNVVDTTAPTFTAIPQEFYLGRDPEAQFVVKDIFDISGATVEYDDPEMKLDKGGNYDIGVRVTDGYGNSSVQTVPFYIKEDVTPPVIEGVTPLETIIGKPVSYLQHVTVTDDYDPDPIINVDTSQVNYTKSGIYPITYTATDDVGNKTEVETHLTVFVSKTAGYTDPKNAAKVAEAYKKADKILAKITNNKMTDVEKAMAIFYWVHKNIGMSGGSSDYRSWAHAACRAFDRRYASCYGQWACCKALLDAAGIENICVKRWPKASYNNRTHYWCLVKLNGEWYHCDASVFIPKKGGFLLFMMTDSEIKHAMGNHNFQSSKYPKRATKSVQQYVYPSRNSVSKNFPYKKTATVTPTPTPKP